MSGLYSNENTAELDDFNRSTMDQQFLNNTTSYITQICSRFNNFQISAHNVDNIKTGKKLINYHKNILLTLKSSIKSLETILNDSLDLLQDMTNDLIQEQRSDDFVYMTTLGMLSYNGRGAIKDRSHVKGEIKQQQKIQLPIKTLIPQVRYSLNVQHIKRLDEAKSMFYFYDNNLYCRLINEIYVKVPFPEIYDSAKNYERKCSVRCKYKTKDICNKHREMSAKLYNSPRRACNFAHIGERIVKIGYSSRCPSRPNYGNPDTIAEDSKYITMDDIKSLLMYGLNDMITAAIWLDYKKEKITFDDLTVA